MGWTGPNGSPHAGALGIHGEAIIDGEVVVVHEGRTKAAAMMAGRYAHAKQFRRHRRQLRILRSRLGGIIRDIQRKIEGQPALEEAFALPLGRATQIRSQQQRQRRPQLPPHPRLVQRTLVPLPVHAMAHARLSSPAQFGFLTHDYRLLTGSAHIHVDYMLTSMPTGTSTIFGVFQAIWASFIRRHSKAWARSPCRNALDRSPCRKALAHNLDHNAFARSRDPHDAWAHCRLVQKPRGTDR